MKAGSARAVLILFIAVGILFRCVGLDWGIPAALPPEATDYRSSFHFDEDNYLWGLARMQPESWNFNVHDFHWGTLQFYLVGVSLVLAQRFGYLTRPWKDAFLNWDPASFPRVYLTGRLVSAIAGILSLWAIFLVGKKLQDTDTGLVAAAFLAVSPLHVVNSHFLTSDITMVLLLLLALYYFLASLETEEMKTHIASGFFLGLAIAAKYNAAYMFPLWLGRDLFQRGRDWKQKLWSHAAVVAGFAAGEPYAFIYPRRFLATVYRSHLANSEAINLFLSPWHQLLAEQGKAVLHYGVQWTLAVTAATGFIFCIARPSKKSAALIAAIVLMVASLVGARWAMIRYTLPLVPLLILLAALALSALPLRNFWRPWTYLLLGSLPLLISWEQVRLLMRDHPANRAARWVDSHIPEGSRIGQIWPELPALDSRKYNIHYLHGIFPHDAEDPHDLDREYLILDNLPITPFTEKFSTRLAREYVAVAEFRSETTIGRWILPSASAPHDWKYTHPVLTIHKRK